METIFRVTDKEKTRDFHDKEEASAYMKAVAEKTGWGDVYIEVIESEEKPDHIITMSEAAEKGKSQTYRVTDLMTGAIGKTDAGTVLSLPQSEEKPKTVRKPRSDKGKAHNKPDKPAKKRRSRGTYFVVPVSSVSRCASIDEVHSVLDRMALAIQEGEFVVIQGKEFKPERNVQYKLVGV